LALNSNRSHMVPPWHSGLVLFGREIRLGTDSMSDPRRHSFYRSSPPLRLFGFLDGEHSFGQNNLPVPRQTFLFFPFNSLTTPPPDVKIRELSSVAMRVPSLLKQWFF